MDKINTPDPQERARNLLKEFTDWVIKRTMVRHPNWHILDIDEWVDDFLNGEKP